MNQVPLARIAAYWADRLDPEAIALVHEEARLSWRQLDAAVEPLGAGLPASWGVGRNDFVTIALPNGIEFFIACFAVWKLGATPQPVSAKLPRFERKQIIELAAPALIVGVPDGEHPGSASTPGRLQRRRGIQRAPSSPIQRTRSRP